MHVPILFKGQDIDTLFTFHHTQNNQTFTINLAGIIHEAIFDPERWIITKDPVVLNVERSYIVRIRHNGRSFVERVVVRR